MTALLGDKGFHYGRVGLALVGDRDGPAPHRRHAQPGRAGARPGAASPPSAGCSRGAVRGVRGRCRRSRNEVMRVEVGYFVAAFVLCGLLYGVYRQGPAAARVVERGVRDARLGEADGDAGCRRACTGGWWASVRPGIWSLRARVGWHRPAELAVRGGWEWLPGASGPRIGLTFDSDGRSGRFRTRGPTESTWRSNAAENARAGERYAGRTIEPPAFADDGRSVALTNPMAATTFVSDERPAVKRHGYCRRSGRTEALHPHPHCQSRRFAVGGIGLLLTRRPGRAARRGSCRPVPSWPRSRGRCS